MEDNGFRRIKRLMGVSHVSVINWVKQFASKFKNLPKKCQKVGIIELDEMCISIYGFGLKSFKNLCENIAYINAKS